MRSWSLIVTLALACAGNTAQATVGSPAELLTQAQRLFDDLEYESVLPLTDEVLAQPGLDPELKLEAYLLQAQAFVVVGQVSQAEQPFRLIFRARPEFDLPADTPPKILAVWRKVQVDESALLAQLEAVHRKRMIAALTLDGGPVTQPVGGSPLYFNFELEDPDNAVEELKVAYRKIGATAYSQLAVDELRRGLWRGAIAGEWTASDDGFTLEYFVETRDGSGPLLTTGTAGEPLTIAIAAGSVPMPKPIPQWAFWTSTGATAAVAVASVLLGILTLNTQAEYDRMAMTSMQTPIDGGALIGVARQGNDYAMATNGLLITTGVLALTTGLLLPFTDFDAEEPYREVGP